MLIAPDIVAFYPVSPKDLLIPKVPLTLILQFFRTHALYTPTFILLGVVSLLFYVSDHLVTPVIAQYFMAQFPTQPEALGYAMSAFMIASLISRPFLGKLTDEKEPRTLMILGAAAFVLAPFLYGLCQGPLAFTLVRILHGVGFGLFVTASSGYLIHILPAHHRAEGISFHGNAVKLALAISPGLAIHWVAQHQWTWVFGASAALALITGVLTFWLPRIREPEALVSETQTHEKPTKGKWINPKAVFPGLILASNSALFGALIPFAPLMAQEKHWGEAGLFYTAYVACLIGSRAFTGRLSDRFGRLTMILPGMALVILSIYAISLAPTSFWFIAAAGLYGLAAGVVQPSLIAMVADRIETHERGSAMGTMTLMSDLGQACGYQLIGSLGVIIGFSQALPVVTLLTISGWIAMFVYQQRQNQHDLNQASLA